MNRLLFGKTNNKAALPTASIWIFLQNFANEESLLYLCKRQIVESAFYLCVLRIDVRICLHFCFYRVEIHFRDDVCTYVQGGKLDCVICVYTDTPARLLAHTPADKVGLARHFVLLPANIRALRR